MTTLPMTSPAHAVWPDGAHRAEIAEPVARYGFDETCSILVGWQRRDAVLRMLSPTVAIVGGVVGLRPGDSVRLVVYRADVTVTDCAVTRATLQGVELTRRGAGDAAAEGSAKLQ